MGPGGEQKKIKMVSPVTDKHFTHDKGTIKLRLKGRAEQFLKATNYLRLDIFFGE
jgi:hypothetical protein